MLLDIAFHLTDEGHCTPLGHFNVLLIPYLVLAQLNRDCLVDLNKQPREAMSTRTKQLKNLLFGALDAVVTQR